MVEADYIEETTALPTLSKDWDSAFGPLRSQTKRHGQSARIQVNKTRFSLLPLHAVCISVRRSP
jgi:hypothetical protein